MALLETKNCVFCRQDETFANGQCLGCAGKEAKSKCDAADALWNSLTDSQRIDELRRRVESLEVSQHQQPAVYERANLYWRKYETQDQSRRRRCEDKAMCGQRL